VKIFFDTLPPEDSRSLATIVDCARETLLFCPACLLSVPVVKYLLSRGVDPCARDLGGQTPYVKLKTLLSLQGTPYGVAISMGVLFATGNFFTSNDANQVLALLEREGGVEATATDDYIFTSEEIDEIQSSLKSAGTKIQDYLASDRYAEAQYHLQKFHSSSLPYALWLWTSDLETLVSALKRTLERWNTRRKEGSIPPDALPEGWAEYFAEANGQLERFWKIFIREDELPRIKDFVKTTAITITERFLDNNGLGVLDRAILVGREVERTGSLDEIIGHGEAIIKRVVIIWSRNFQMSFISKVCLLQRLKRIWRSLNRGEILDLLHGVAVAAGVDETLDAMAQNMAIVALGGTLKPPRSANEMLSLSRRYPDTTIFITSTTYNLWPKRILLAFVQSLIFLFPAFGLIIKVHLDGMSLCSDSIWMPLLAYLWTILLPNDWVFIDEDYWLHPNIWRGILATAELLQFRLRHPFIMEEPLILSVRSRPPKHVDIPTRMDSMQKGSLFPLYWLPLRRNGNSDPIPCYAAMGDLVRKWENGQLPRKAWCDGWWELSHSKRGEWIRVNANVKPTWTDYCKASKDIKVSAIKKIPCGLCAMILIASGRLFCITRDARISMMSFSP
jgi:hypothetical protein